MEYFNTNTDSSDNLIEKLKSYLNNKNFYIKTYGCQMNVNDSYDTASLMESFGMTMVLDVDKADIIIINTCCVREKAESKVYSYIGKLKKLKISNENLIIIITGCMSEQSDIRDDLFSRFHFVDIVIGTGKIDQMPAYILKNIENNIRIRSQEHNLDRLPIPNRTSKRVSEFVTIMTGCNNFCSYCIVPYVRGRETSRDNEDILKEINNLVAQGCKEITLLGQNVNSYGQDKDEITFWELLKMADEETDIQRIRFMTSHPKDISYKLLDTMASSKKVCKHIHLPVQSGSDRILLEMNRKYDTKHYLSIVEYARNIMPEIEFTTDIIVGFPGETDDDFEQTLELVEKVRYTSAYMFKYSVRTGTPAAELQSQVPDSVKSQRLDRLMKLENKIKKEIYNSYINKTLPILIEGTGTQDKDYTGKTSSGITVNYSGDPTDVGKIINIKIDKAKANTLHGLAQKEN